MNMVKEIIHDLKNYRSLLSELIRRDIKIKYRRSVLGIFWSFLDPLLSMIVLTIVFSTLFHRIPNYPIYYLTGLLAFQLFSNGSKTAMRSLVGSSGIWKTIYVPKFLYVLSAVLSNFVTYLLSLVVLFVIMAILNVQFTIYIVFASLPILALIIMTVGAGLIMGTLNVFFRDMEYLYNVFMMILMYGMPIFYPADIVPASFQFIQQYNPLYQLIVCLRDCFLYGQMYSLSTLLFGFISAIILLIIGILLLYKYQDRFVLYV
ncbi:ABC transporter permease [Methanosphaera cuniculi]|uniref:Polysialic acid transport protein KpsM n=2 Tax=Methanosphaera cuniculi TaxID=1077256 RepID=A0A2V2BTD4_9EURY|nr:polysialic acid transport protein KpsM [Methanosphaera cuniculi]